MASEKVLIVEDNVAAEGRPLEGLLKANGFNVVGIASSADEAVQLAKREKPLLVLMDIMLPDDQEGGVNAALEIRKVTGAEIIYITGADTSDDLMKKVDRTEPFGFLTKPPTDQNVVALLKLFRVKREGKRVVFVCYARENREMKTELCRFLEALNSCGIDPWDDEKIRYGDNWKEEIGGVVRRSDVAILLIDIEFLNSRFIQEFELPELLKAQRDRAMRVLTVYVGSVPKAVLQEKGLTEFHGINSPDDPLDQWDKPKRAREAWKRICDFLTDNR